MRNENASNDPNPRKTKDKTKDLLVDLSQTKQIERHTQLIIGPETPTPSEPHRITHLQHPKNEEACIQEHADTHQRLHKLLPKTTETETETERERFAGLLGFFL